MILLLIRQPDPRCTYGPIIEYSHSTDLSIKTGHNIPIEERDPQEILHIYGYNFNLPQVATVYNPAFDVTPGNYLTGIITEAGIIYQPSKKTVAEIVIPFLKEKK